MGKGMENLLRKTAIFAIITAVIYLVLYFFFDRAIVLWIHHSCSETWLPRLSKYTSYLAEGSFVTLGIALCFILILVCDSGIKRRETRLLLYICICGAIAITIGDGLKYLLGRYRPIMLFDHNLYGLHFFSSKWVLNSTPSDHTIRAFSLLTALSMLCRRFTVLFISLAGVIGLSRVGMTDHYPSDVVFGAFIGTCTALWVYVHFFPEGREDNE